MKPTALSMTILMALACSAAAGCAQQVDDDGDATSADAVSSSGPQGLAQWLGNNHTVRYLGQFLDFRPGAQTPYVAGRLNPELVPAGGIGAMASVLTSHEVETMLAVGREADAQQLPIVTGEPTASVNGDLECGAEPGIYVYGSRPKWLFDAMENPFEPTMRPLVDEAYASGTTEVVIALRGDALTTRMLTLSFGIVQRPLSDRPDAPVGHYWTIRAARLGEARCAVHTRTVYAFAHPSGDNLLTINEGERGYLTQGGWFEQAIGPRSGSFKIGMNDGPNRIPLYRCATATGHFFSTQERCEGQRQEGLLGYGSPVGTEATPQALRRCYGTGGHHYHVLNGACSPGAQDDGIQLWVP